MKTVRLSFPPVTRPGSVAEQVLSTAFLLLGRAELGRVDAGEAVRLLDVVARAIRHGRLERTITASTAVLSLIASSCRRRAGELYEGCEAMPVLLTIALGCEAAAEAQAA